MRLSFTLYMSLTLVSGSIQTLSVCISSTVVCSVIVSWLKSCLVQSTKWGMVMVIMAMMMMITLVRQKHLCEHTLGVNIKLICVCFCCIVCLF